MAEENTVPEAERSAGLYVHVPFCRKKCPYCSFHSHPPQPGDYALFTEAVLAQLHLLAREPSVQALHFATIFFGGGTPSLLPPARLAQLLQACRQKLHCAAQAETSIEVNPGTVDAPILHALRQAGFNRLSLGVQSFRDRELELLGRIHNAREAELAYAEARRAGFDNISIDLIYGLPGQSPTNWRGSLEKALSLGPEHLSLYELSAEAPSPFYQALGRGALRLPDEEAVLAMMAVSNALTQASGLVRYEISNYARPGFFCRHNIGYWQNGSYLGLGPGAVSALEGRRYRTIAELARYHRLALAGVPAWREEERLDTEQSFRETVIMGLRMLRGVSARTLRRRYHLDLRSYYGPVLERLVEQGLLDWQGDRLALTARGLPLANQVMAELV